MGIAKDIQDKIDFIRLAYEQGMQAILPARRQRRGMILYDTLTDTYKFEGKRYTAIEWEALNESEDIQGMTVIGPDVPEVVRPRIEVTDKPAELKQPVDFLNRRHKKVRKNKEVKQPDPVVMTDKVVTGRMESYGETWGLTADRDWKKNKVITHAV